MLLLSVSICVGLMLTLPECTHQSCVTGDPEECADADFAPGTNLAGEGFDITKMERKGAFVINMNQWRTKDQKCMLCTNPYLENKKQKLPLSVVDWRTKQSCSANVDSKLYESSESLVSSSSSSVENNWKVSLNVDIGGNGGSLMLAGTNSKLAEYSLTKTKSDKFSFTRQSMSCEYYSYRLSSSPALHNEFEIAVKGLPKMYNFDNKKLFYKFIDNFGTHYITKVKLGGRVSSVTSIRDCMASLEGLSLEEVQMCLEAEASASVKGVKMGTESKHCQKDSDKMESKSSFSTLFNDRFTEIKGGHTTEPDLLFSSQKNPAAYKDWLVSLPQNPDIVSYSLEALHELLPGKDPARKNLRSAISHYILEKGLWKNCSNPCQIGIKSDRRDSCVCQCHNEPAVNRNCCPVRKGMAQVTITVQRGEGLRGDDLSATDGYVKVSFNGVIVQQSPIIHNNNNPYWGMVVNLGSVDVSSGKVGFQVWDEDNWNDDFLGSCDQVLTAGVKEDVCTLQHGRVYFKLEVKCAPSLSGDSCSEYTPSPMSKSLSKLYVSRHAHPVPKAVLLKMGVFVDGLSSPRNQSEKVNLV